MNRLTIPQAERLQHLLATGPHDRRDPVDTQLIELGWAQLYDDTDAVEGHTLAAEALYDGRGCIKEHLLPAEWLLQLKTSRQRAIDAIGKLEETAIENGGRQ